MLLEIHTNSLIHNSKIAYFLCCFLPALLLFSTSNAQEIESDSIVLNSNLISDDKIDELVISSAKDSIDYDIQNNKVFLYNNAEIKYGSITLQAAYIELDSDKNIVLPKVLSMIVLVKTTVIPSLLKMVKALLQKR